LTGQDKALVDKAVFTGQVFKKTNVWVMGQTVYFIAGRGVNETADGLWGVRKVLKDKAVQLSKVVEDEGECRVSEDCGSDYYGPWVCSDRMRAARVLYKPYCRYGVCMQKGMRSSTRTCRRNEVCISFLGCVSNKTLPVSDGVYTPFFRTWLSRERQTAIKGHDVKLVLYARSYANETLKCEYYDGEWKSMGRLSGNNTATVLLNVSTNTTGRFNMTQRVRCGNVTGDDDEFRTRYYAEHNFTLMVIPPPIAFTFTLTPANVTLADCFDEKNVTIRIENLCGNNISCNYTVGEALTQVFITRPGVTYNVSERRWVFNRTNVTYAYMSYYSGSDFQNASVRKKDADGNYYWYNVSQADIDAYANEPKNYSFVNVTSGLKKVSTYYWDYPHWSENVFWVDSEECMLRWVPVGVTCTDEYGQRTTLNKDIYLNYTYD
jgi:hypothetical protein